MAMWSVEAVEARGTEVEASACSGWDFLHLPFRFFFDFFDFLRGSVCKSTLLTESPIY
jgi:hypothetical protein